MGDKWYKMISGGDGGVGGDDVDWGLIKGEVGDVGVLIGGRCGLVW